MKFIKLFTITAALASFSPFSSATQATITVGESPLPTKTSDIKMYPLAGKKQVRHIISLTPLENEQDAKIELRFSKVIEALP